MNKGNPSPQGHLVFLKALVVVFTDHGLFSGYPAIRPSGNRMKVTSVVFS